jgi:hypothetical protein
MADQDTSVVPSSSRTSIAAVLCLAGAMFLIGIAWGLPSKAADPFLFGSAFPWTGADVMQLAGPWTAAAERGADRPQNGQEDRRRAIVVNATDADRAEIVRRYRLYSQQPDEMITFRSLSGMDPAHLKFDPRLYQYGGLWIYPIGGLIKAASLLQLVTVRSDVAWYLDHPEQFARFYLIARFYCVAWGLAGACIVYAVAKQWSGSDIGGWAAAAVFAVMPVVVNSAHEAKPHLAGTVLTIAAVGAGLKYLQTGRRRWCFAAGAIAGAATGMVLTGYAAFAVPVVAGLIGGRRAGGPGPSAYPRTALRGTGRRIGLAGGAVGVGVFVFVLTNPYLLANLVFHRGVVGSNVGNYGNFYRPGLSVGALINAGRLVLEGASIGPVVMAGIAIIFWTLRRRFPAGTLVLVAPAVVTVVQFTLLAADKPAEYARFAETADVVIAILAAGLIARLRLTERERTLAGATLVAATLWFGIRYDINFIANDRPGSNRIVAAELLRQMGNPPVAVRADPAPYFLPPVNLFDAPIVLLPPGGSPTPEQVLVRPADYAAGVLSPISWANKPIEMSRGGMPVFSPVIRP